MLYEVFFVILDAVAAIKLYEYLATLLVNIWLIVELIDL